MTQLHTRLGMALIAVLVVGVLTTLISVRRPQLRPTVLSYLRLCEVAAALQAAGGLALVFLGWQPGSSLHWMYGALTVSTLPLAERASARTGHRTEARWLALGAFATLLFAARAATTG